MPRSFITRRTFATAAAVAGAALAAPALRAQGRPERSRISVAVGGRTAFYFLPLTIVEQLGYFKAEGLDVDIIDHGVGGKALQSLVGGTADVMSGPYEQTINMQARSQYIQSIVLMARAPQIAMGVSTRTMPNFRSVAELRGRTIGVSAPGASTQLVANMVLARAGVRPTEVNYVGVGTSAPALAAMRTAQVDAISNTEPVMTMLEQRGDVKIICDTRTLKGTYEIFGGPMPASCFCARAEFVRSYPNTCQALANAIVRGLKWLQTAGPSDIIKTVPEAYLLGDRGLYLASFNKLREAIAIDGILPDEGARTALKALARFQPGIDPDRIDLARTYTNEFARRAKEKFGV